MVARGREGSQDQGKADNVFSSAVAEESFEHVESLALGSLRDLTNECHLYDFLSVYTRLLCAGFVLPIAEYGFHSLTVQAPSFIASFRRAVSFCNCCSLL